MFGRRPTHKPISNHCHEYYSTKWFSIDPSKPGFVISNDPNQPKMNVEKIIIKRREIQDATGWIRYRTTKSASA